MKSGYSTTIPKRKTKVAIDLNIDHDRTFMVRRSCSVSGGKKGLVYYELLKPGDSITGDRYRLQLIDRLSHALREKRSEYEQRHDKLFVFMTTLSLMSC